MPVLEDTTVHGCEAVAGREDGHGQVEITVVRLSDLVAGPRR